jgi:hypothetical protein
MNKNTKVWHWANLFNFIMLTGLTYEKIKSSKKSRFLSEACVVTKFNVNVVP